MGRAKWENLVACPHEQDLTIVVGLDDAANGFVLVYVGTKVNAATAAGTSLFAKRGMMLKSIACSCSRGVG